MGVREATPDDALAVRTVVDGAALWRGVDDLDATIAEGDVLVAAEAGRVLGALVLDGQRVAAIAVRRRRRDQGLGRALVGAARERRECLCASFDPSVRPFWEAVGFEVTGRTDDGRYCARFPP